MAKEHAASESSGSKSRDTQGQAPSQEQVRERVQSEAAKGGSKPPERQASNR